jgi:hypothetical protein
VKGKSFQKPFELSLLVEGESWRQGDSIQGTLAIKNHSSEMVSLDEIQVQLVLGDLKKVKQKSEGAFKSLGYPPVLAQGQLEPQQEVTFPWKFETDRNCPITDNSGSLFLLYGPGTGESFEKVGHLQLIVSPFAVIEDFMKDLETHFRFIRKSQKSGKKSVEVKYLPPDSRAFASLDHLVLLFSFESEKLDVKYVFQVKKVEASAATIELKKQKREVSQSFTPDQYFLPSGRFNHERIEESIREALSSVESKVRY